jgi:hypothetical protein
VGEYNGEFLTSLVLMNASNTNELIVSCTFPCFYNFFVRLAVQALNTTSGTATNNPTSPVRTFDPGPTCGNNPYLHSRFSATTKYHFGQ